jgi:hypothetical protein
MPIAWLTSLGRILTGATAKHTEIVINGFEKLLAKQEAREKILEERVHILTGQMDRLIKMEEQCLQEHVEQREEIRNLREILIFTRNKKKNEGTDIDSDIAI